MATETSTGTEQNESRSLHKLQNEDVMGTIEDRVRRHDQKLNALSSAIMPLGFGPGPYVGQRVHYRLGEGPGYGEVRGADVVRVLDEDGTVVLKVTTDEVYDEHVPTYYPQVRPGNGIGQYCAIRPYDVDRDKKNALDGPLEENVSDETGWKMEM